MVEEVTVVMVAVMVAAVMVAAVMAREGLAAAVVQVDLAPRAL